jgi:hypothetical protein
MEEFLISLIWGEVWGNPLEPIFTPKLTLWGGGGVQWIVEVVDLDYLQ